MLKLVIKQLSLLQSQTLANYETPELLPVTTIQFG